MRILRALVVTCIVLAVLAAGAGAAGSKPRLGAYDCYAYEYIGFYTLVYKHSAKLKKDGNYLQAFDTKFTNATKGKWAYKADKKKIVFKTGAFSTIYGKWNQPDASHPKGSYTEYLKGTKSSPGTCYPRG